jgi:hypothetical protein
MSRRYDTQNSGIQHNNTTVYILTISRTTIITVTLIEIPINSITTLSITITLNTLNKGMLSIVVKNYQDSIVIYPITLSVVY